MCGVTSAASCNNPDIVGLVISTNRTVYGINASVLLEPITVVTTGIYGQYVLTGSENVSVIAPPGLTLAGTLNATTVNGNYTFSNITASNMTRGTYYIGFMLCNGVRTDQLQVVFRASNAVAVKWIVAPLPSATSYGYLPYKPSLAFVDSQGDITDMPFLAPWVLGINDTSFNISGNVFIPTVTSGQLATFKNLTFYTTDAQVGHTVRLELIFIGNQGPNNSSYVFPPPQYITIVACNADFSITPADNRSTLQYFNIPQGSGPVVLQGWAFLPQLQSVMRCSYNNLTYPMNVLDICHVECLLPASLPANKGYALEYSTNGYTFDYIGNLTIIDLNNPLHLYEQSGSDSQLYVFRDTTVNVTAHIMVVDSLGNFVYRWYSGTPTVTCNSTAYYAQQDRIYGPYFNLLLQKKCDTGPVPQHIRLPGVHGYRLCQ